MIEDTLYKGVFRGLHQRMRRYRLAQRPGKMLDEQVMADLFKFARFFSPMHEPGQSTDEVLILEGRRQVILRILQHTRLTVEELFPIVQGLDEPTRIALFDNQRPGLPMYEDR